MSFYRHTSVSHPIRAVQARCRTLVALAHPGGHYPGVELPPTWFSNDDTVRVVGSAFPEAGDRLAIVEGVRQMCLDIRDMAQEAFAAGEHPILIGGDHSLAMGTLAAATAHHKRVGVIWIDAHADFNTFESSPTGNPHGMPLAAACGIGDARLTGMFERFVDTGDVVLIGAREIDPEEQELLAKHGVWAVGVPELREMGVPALVAAIAERLKDLPVHLSFDFDSLSEEFFSATGTPSPNGLTPDEGEALLQGLVASGLAISSSDWVEFDPRHAQAPEAAQTAQRMFRSVYGEQ